MPRRDSFDTDTNSSSRADRSRLGSRGLPAAPSTSGAAPGLGARLREVLERDRALMGSDGTVETRARAERAFTGGAVPSRGSREASLDGLRGLPNRELVEPQVTTHGLGTGVLTLGDESDHGFDDPESGTRMRIPAAKPSEPRDILDDLIALQEEQDREEERARQAALEWEEQRIEYEDGFHETLDPEETEDIRETLAPLIWGDDTDTSPTEVEEPATARTPEVVLRPTARVRSFEDDWSRTLRTSVDSPFATARFADWIAEEIAELDPLSSAPIALGPVATPSRREVLDEPLRDTEPDLRREPTRDFTREPVHEAPRAAKSEPMPPPLEAIGGREPIRTRTMARLLAGHGYRARALSIYDELLQRDPNQPGLRAEAEALRKT